MCTLVANDQLIEAAHTSPAGPICGFSSKVLISTLQASGFARCFAGSVKPNYKKWVALRDVHQLSHVTALDRYPALYAGAAAVAEALHGHQTLQILVLGCSTGEEPFTLAQRYFTRASHRLDAADIAAAAVETAVQQHAHPRIRYFRVGEPGVAGQHCYQLVFANSIFCRWPASRGATTIAELYPFAAFEAALAEIDQQLATGGLLALYNANYRLGDTVLAGRYVPLKLQGLDESGFVTKFDPDGQLSCDQAYPYALFLKLADATVSLAPS